MGPAYVDEFERQVLDPQPLFISNAVLQQLEAIPTTARRLQPAITSNSIVPEQEPAPATAPPTATQVHQPDPLLTFVSLVGLGLVIIGLFLQIPVNERLCFFLEECHHLNVTRIRTF